MKPAPPPASAGAPPPAVLLELARVAVCPAPGAPPVLAGVSFGLQAGQCAALVGPSGAGKTSLLRTIALALAPGGGRILLDGEDLAMLAGERRRRARMRIAIVAQKHDLVEALRVDRNVMAGRLGRWSNARALRYLFWASGAEVAEARAALDAVGLGDMVRRPTAALSGGEQQRVAIARALVQAPRLLLADEPIASLDPVTARSVLAHLTRSAREGGMALLMSLHQPELAAEFCDRFFEVGGGVLRERPGVAAGGG